MAGRGLGDRWELPDFSKKLGVGMLNMRFGDFHIFVQKIGSLVFLGYHTHTHTHTQTIVNIMIVTKEAKNFLGPPICVH